ncbi:surface antigen-domain-containing protein [Halteromyces radiatus]|uniref:surface antigen-domain-containing protein n=1 Tax=Halteromyces radiatus TaxID=101107 RepID=UPI00221FA5FF|nr:surface antigen-domain-containing protein [Halteromyces radiatus]KAI8082793.1 surface antigen-domain-containing protein [Halteromyces radiatus]
MASSVAHVNAVSIHGTRYTRPTFLETVSTPILEAKTIADVVNLSQDIAEKLMRFDIFEDVQVLLDHAADTDPLAAPDSINVVYNVKEKSRFFIKTGTEIGNNEGNMNGSLTIRNVFGGAETLESVASFGNRTSSAFQFTLSSPVKANPDSKIDLNAHHVLRNNKLYSGYEELSRGAALRYKTVSNFGYHELSYDCTWRSIDKFSLTASESARAEAGQSLKSSLNHTFIRDRRDDMLLPGNGHYIRLTQELAGVLNIGNASFFKSELETQVCHRFGGGQLLKNEENELIGLHPGFVISLGLKAGWLANLNDEKKASTISDRFLLGGPLSVRGFRTAGIGPRDYKDALGGNIYWATGISAMTPLPTFEHKPIRAHAFINAGTAVPWSTKTSAQDTASSLMRSPSIAVGFGLVYRHSIARLELNYCIPLTAAKGDQVHRGLQFGIGLNFL